MFPNMMLHFDIGRKKSIAAVEEALKSDQKIFLVTQKNIKDENPKEDEIYSFGVLATVKQILKQTDEVTRILVEGNCRAEAIKFVIDEDFVKAEIVQKQDENFESNLESEALIRTLEKLFAEHLSLSPRAADDLILNIPSKLNLSEVTDYVASNVVLDFEKKQELLSELDPVKRSNLLIKYLSHENAVLNCEFEIGATLKKSIDQSQKEYLIREQIKFLSQELDESQDPLTEADEYRKKLDKLVLPKDTYKKLRRECDNLSKTPFGSSEANIISTYLETCLSLPWNNSSEETIDINNAEFILNRDHYGLKEVKERILEFLAVCKLSKDIKGQIICLVGPPGVGKTSIAKSLAEAMGRKYTRISLGGVNDESEIRGHRKTYIGAMPGRIITAIKQAGVNNPLVLLDEIDKLSNDYHGDPAAALLEALDPEQNSAFYDRYVEVPFDLSKTLFIATANDKENIPLALMDRMEIIELCSYTNEEKFHIAKEHLIPKQLKRHGLDEKQFSISDKAIDMVISGYTSEAGVRELERKISSLMRKTAKAIVESSKKSVKISDKNLKKILGAVKFKNKLIDNGEHIGVANGLAWTSVGGEVLPIEVSFMPGKGDIQITGSLGEIMRESVQLCVSYIRANAKKIGVKSSFYKNQDIHIHAPEGAVPKDGPSAGVTILTALVSALSGARVAEDVAMTGEITLKGQVLAIGGLKEKTMAAYKAGMKRVLIPVDNVGDLEKIDDAVKEKIEFIPVKNVKDVLKHALIKK